MDFSASINRYCQQKVVFNCYDSWGPRLAPLIRHLWTGSFLSRCLWNLDISLVRRLVRSKFEQLMVIFLSKWVATAWGICKWPLELLIFWGFSLGGILNFFDHVDGWNCLWNFCAWSLKFRKLLFRRRRRGWNDIMNPSDTLLISPPTLKNYFKGRHGQDRCLPILVANP